MATLSSQQRRQLEAAVKRARRAAEEGARNALQSLGVDHPEPFTHLTPGQRALRNILRSKARLLRDELLPDGTQQIDHLVYELAYETWHKMLFARFLEANDLLMHPEGVAVTLEECEELAQEEGYADKWDTAAAYASRMLPAIFRPGDPLMQVPFATEDRLQLEEIIAGMDETVFRADDALGWVYQFWQSEAKEKINKSGDKIDGERLPAVTQLFTEPYMVHFLIDNTIGTWWVSRHPNKEPPVKFEYLRIAPTKENLRQDGGATLDTLTIMDPAMGSGHFLAELFRVLAPLRMQEEGLAKEEAADRVIAENLHGLEIDPRCTQIAAFNLAFTAWKFIEHYRELPEMNLACSGIAPKGKVEDWVKLVGKTDDPVQKTRLQNGMRALYEHFQLAPELGSLLDPSAIGADAFTAGFDELQPVLKKALEQEAGKEQIERGVMAAGIAKAGLLLSKKYTLQITNVPYLGKGKQGKVLADYVSKYYPLAKADLATVFLQRLIKMALPGGTIASVLPQNWLFLTTYKKIREFILKNYVLNFIARLGEHAFENSEAAGAFACLFSLSVKKPGEKNSFIGINVSNNRGERPIYANEKKKLLKTAELKTVRQKEQLGNPDARIVFDKNVEEELLSKYAKALQGIATGDFSRYGRLFYEINKVDNKNWIYQQTTFTKTSLFEGKNNIIYWEEGNGSLCNSSGARIQGLESMTKTGIAISQMAVLGSTINLSTIFDNNTSVILPYNEKHLIPIWLYCSSSQYNIEIRKIDQKTSVTNATLVKVPFNLKYWQKVVEEKYPDGLPEPYSDDPTQWLFHGHPAKAEHTLQVAVARLLGYRWPAESDPEMELAAEARGLIAAVKAFDHHTDEDGIVCLPPVNGEPPAAGRLHDYLQEVFAGKWDNRTLARLLQQEDAKANNPEQWLRDEFFKQHCRVFKNRPFIWHIWDGRKDGFAALVNYHKLDKENLSKLIYTYLGDWIRRCEAKKEAGESGAEGLLAAALQLKEKLEAILEGEAPYDIFVRWKPLEEQPLGWDPDLNDGVRLNIRPFVTAGVLRSKFNIKWGIDRGKNPPGSPWGEIRDNSRHLTLEEKRIASEKIKNNGRVY